MIGNIKYMPILKGKMGEFGAIQKLSKTIKNSINPLIDIPKVPMRFPERIPQYSIDTHLEKIATKIRNAWGAKRPVFIDLFDFDLSTRTSTGIHYLQCIFNNLSLEGVQPIFTTGLDRDADYNQTLRDILSDSQQEVCFRLMDDDLEIIEDLEDELGDLMDELGVTPSDIHLILDFRSIPIDRKKQIINLIVQFITKNSLIHDWKSLIIAGSSFPDSLSNIAKNSEVRVPRIEFSIWKLLMQNSKKLKRVPAFGDYGVVYPNAPELDPRTINPSAKIRYTVENDWIILKGHSLKRHPKYQQYHSLSMKLSNDADFLGSSFSWGDQYILDCGKKNVTTGNLTTWVKVDSNHHLTYVSDQIANYF